MAEPQPQSIPLEVPPAVPGDTDSPWAGLQDWEADHDQRMAWFNEARFGMFVHFGLYTAAGGNWPPGPEGKPAEQNYAEWIEAWAEVPTPEYASALRPLFAPEPGCTDAWAALAKEAGMRYAVLTTKHHEGFTLFNSAQPYSVHNDFSGGTNISPQGRDLTKEFADSMHAQGIKVGLYYSLVDWQHPNSRTRAGFNGGRQGVTDDEPYHAYLKAHINELLSNYGPIEILWSDFTLEQDGKDPWDLENLLTEARKLQPQIIINNRFWPGLENPNGDFFTPEKWVPETGIPGRDFEVNHTMNESYGFSYSDDAWKSGPDVVRLLVDIVSKGGNLILNVGPDPQGHIPEASVTALKQVGGWMKVNSEAIYGTHAGGIAAKDLSYQGRILRKDQADGSKTVYLALFELPENGLLTLPFETALAQRVSVLGQEGELAIQGETAPFTVQLPKAITEETLVPVLRVDVSAYPKVTEVTSTEAQRSQDALDTSDADNKEN